MNWIYDFSERLGYMDNILPITYKISSLSQNCLELLLEKISDEYDPPLRNVVCLSDYAKKIILNGTIFEAWHDGNLIGFVAGYFNDIQTGKSFITLVYVDPSWRKNNIGSHLMNNAINFAKAQKFKSMSLSVKINNVGAQKLYTKLGFCIVDKGEISYSMKKDLS